MAAHAVRAWLSRRPETAAEAAAPDASLTRNIRDFEACDIPLIDPFAGYFRT